MIELKLSRQVSKREWLLLLDRCYQPKCSYCASYVNWTSSASSLYLCEGPHNRLEDVQLSHVLLRHVAVQLSGKPFLSHWNG